MMNRVSNGLLRNNFLHSMHRQQSDMQKVQQQIASQRKLVLPEDDSVATSEYMFQRSRLSDIGRYKRNINFSKGRVDLTEQKLREANTILIKAKELAVQGSNGIMTADDRKHIASQVNQLIKEMVRIGNSQYKGESLFSGNRTDVQAFKVTYSKVVNPETGKLLWGESNITKVEYQGDIGNKYAEVGRGAYVATNMTGNKAFWASNQTIVSGTPGTGYVATQDQLMRIDGVEISVKAGDNLRTVADKINKANLNVRAEIDNTTGQNLLILRTTVPHQVYLEDLNGGTVLQDLGMISSSVAKPPYNYSSSAAVHGESVFQRLIQLRDSLYANDISKVNKGIGGVDQSIQSVLHRLAKVGSVQKRMEENSTRLDSEKLYTNELISTLNGLDMAEAVTKLKNIEMEYNAALQIGAELLPKTLLDYLR